MASSGDLFVDENGGGGRLSGEPPLAGNESGLSYQKPGAP